ncbi:MAG: hypothetical protein OQL19_22395 [Gammaproteobacteria bacterium]|nr:hypothetical protein [Gammaproteobacteria bacterium]
MNNENDNKKGNKFSSAMGDLKGLLDKEGINLKSDTQEATTELPVIDNEISETELPVLTDSITKTENKKNQPDTTDLDDYISDFEDDSIELMDFADSVEELEEKVESITDLEQLHNFEQSESSNVQLNHLKQTLHKKLSLQIETSIDELKTKLLNSMESEINDLFKNISKK